MIKVYAGGKKSKNWVLDGQSEYEKRLFKPFNTEFMYLDDQKIAKLADSWPFSSSDYVILLDERGKNISSPDLSQIIEQQFLDGKTINFVIGGPFGVPQELRDRVDFVWSFSKLVFPHELMRIMLTEQIYRAQEISRGGKYHHL